MVEPFSHPFSLSIAHLKPSGFVHRFLAWLWVVMGLLISFGHGFGVEFWWWIMVGSVWWHGGSRAVG